MADTPDRRTFLQLSGMTLAVAAADPLLAQVRARGGRPSPLRSQLSGKTFVLVFQRGGCDGLNVCVPVETGEYATYASYRGDGGLQLQMADLDPFRLDGNFALHPALAPLHARYQAGEVAVMPNVHYDNGSRSHFDSQAFYESGTPWQKATADGWLSRHMQTLPGNGDVFRAVSFGNLVPAGFRGQPGALSFSNLASLSVSGNSVRDNQVLDAQERIYALPGQGRTYDEEVLRSGQDLIAAIRELRRNSLPATDPTAANLYPRNGTNYTTFANRFRELAQLVKSGAFAIELAEIDQSGYDTHAGQGLLTPDSGAHPQLLTELAQTLDAFYVDIGVLSSEVVTLVITEFGRTARANGNNGTDHGSAMCTLAVGGSVVPGVHFGPAGWTSLTDLREGRDLQHSLDYRDVYSEVLVQFLGNASPAAVFPGWTYAPVGFLG